MNNEDRQKLTAIAAGIKDQGLGKDIVAAGIAKIGADGRIDLTYPYPAASIAKAAAEQIRQQAKTAGLAEPEIAIRFAITRKLAQGGTRPVAGVRNIIAISSAKGGVGKSTIALNLALALAGEGAQTGLLDADIYGPSLPTLLGPGKPEADAKNRIIPLRRCGLQVLSMGHLIAQDQPVIWRGPMVIKALEQLLYDAAWDNLDFLVLDLPPGTGDVQLSIAQKTPIAGAVIITTPHPLAVADAVRGLKMFARVSIPVIGFIENMASFTCPDCGSKHYPFGSGAKSKLTAQHNLECLLSLPLDPDLASGNFQTNSNEKIKSWFQNLATHIGCLLAQRPADMSDKMPPVVAQQANRK